MAGDDIDLDASFLQRAEHARVIRAMRAGPAEHERGPTLWRIGLHAYSRS